MTVGHRGTVGKAKRAGALALLAAVLPLVGRPAFAQSFIKQTNLQVTATVPTICTLNAGTTNLGTLDFGTYNPGAPASVAAPLRSSQATITVACNTVGTTTVVTFAFNNGLQSSASTRNLSNGASTTVPYTLHAFCGVSATWEGGVSGSACASSGQDIGDIGLGGQFDVANSNATFPIIVEARIEQNLPSALPEGDYTDTVVVTASW